MDKTTYETRAPFEVGGPNILARLRSGERCMALGLRNARTPEIVRLAAAAAYDLVWIDMEHAPIGVEAAASLASTAASLGLGGWVRVPEGMNGLVGPLLDGGAGGIIFPHIHSAETAYDAVSACRFPPNGNRSQNALLPQLGYTRYPLAEMMTRADNAAIVQLLIETPQGIDRIDEIVDVPGIDLIALGLNDLSTTMGHAGQPGHLDVIDACKRVVEACRKRNVLVIAGGAGTPDAFANLVELGIAPLAFVGMDTEMLGDILSQRRSKWLEVKS
jgi:2-keto-3-deoxy-L-rhamnonate aldolase RhmA